MYSYREREGPIFNVVLLQQEHVVDGKSTEEEREVEEEFEHLRKLMLDLLFPAWVCGIH